MEHDQADGFASTALLGLVVRVFRHIDPRLLPDGTVEPDALAGGKSPARAKRGLLEYAYRRGGAGPLLCVGQHLETGRGTPIIAALVKSPDPDVLAAKWMRMERYYHSRNRTRIARIEANSWSCHRFSIGPPASPAENILICGLFAGLLGLIGGFGIEIDIGGRRFTSKELHKIGPLEDARTGTFVISWQGFTAKRGEDVIVETGGNSAPQRLKGLLAEDISRNWRLLEAARSLGMSGRSLQRELGKSGRTFSTLVREVRVARAGQALAETGMSLAEIGYCCGYADQAHFQRDFLRALNMTPAGYRRLAAI